VPGVPTQFMRLTEANIGTNFAGNYRSARIKLFDGILEGE